MALVLAPNVLLRIEQARHLYVGYSGGMDSQVLLHLAKRIASQRSIPITALHIHHGLQNDADAFEKHCHKTCQAWQIPLLTENITHLSIHDSNLEAKARHARYQAFTKHITEKPGALLLLGHHMDDQWETQLFHLLRTTGLHALCGIPQYRTHKHFHILRPLLSTPKATLLRYAKKYCLSWMEDPSNLNTNFSRNRIRHTLLPLVKQDPLLIKALQHYQELAYLSNRLNLAMASMDANAKDNPTWPQTLDLQNWHRMDTKRQLNMLRFWLSRHSHQQPSLKHLKTLRKQLQLCSTDQQLQWVHDQHQVRYYQHILYWLPNPLPPPATKPICWMDLSNAIILSTGEAYRVETGLNNVLLPTKQKIIIHFNQGSKKIKFPGKKKAIKLNEWLRLQKIPPWQRPHIPIFYLNNMCIAIGNLLKDDKTQFNSNHIKIAKDNDLSQKNFNQNKE